MSKSVKPVTLSIVGLCLAGVVSQSVILSVSQVKSVKQNIQLKFGRNLLVEFGITHVWAGLYLTSAAKLS